MEQLTLFEPNEACRQPRGKENISEGFQLQYEHRNGQLYQGNSKATLLIGLHLWTTVVLISFLLTLPTILKRQIGTISIARKNISSGLLSGSDWHLAY